MKKLSLFLIFTLIIVPLFTAGTLSQGARGYLSVPYQRFKQQSTAPSATEAGYNLIYAKSGGWYYKSGTGSEVTILDSVNSTDVVLNAHQAVSVNSTTFALNAAGKGIIDLTPSAGSDKTITSITGGTDGQRISLHFGGVVTVSASAAKLSGNVDFVGANHDVLELIYNGTEWAAASPAQQVTGLNGPLGGQTPAAAAVTTLSTTGATTLGDAAGDVITVNGVATFPNASATFTKGQQSAIQAVTATVDGTTTGVIPDGATNVTVTSSVNTKFTTLPTPTPGNVVRIFCAANGYKLQSSAPASVAINGGSGASASLAVAAGDLLIAYCTSSTTWVIIKIGTTGTPASAGAAA
jgi:hypothetical protein